jgi:citrate lyase subunit beta/citryl-CoA lyase
MLFTPGDSLKKMEKGLAGEADALILDLEDSVAAPNRPRARELVRSVLCRPRGAAHLWVRINPLDGDDAERDLAAIVGERPDGIVVPKVNGGEDITRLCGMIGQLERRHGLPDGGILILPVATETARALFNLGTYAGASPRLYGLTWGAEDLAAALGASANRDAQGRLLPTFQTARTLCLAGAAAAGVTAVETVYPDFRDLEGVQRYAEEGRRDGFTGMMAIHPDQVPIINAAFTPSDAEIDYARRVVAAFEGANGVVALDGRMLDQPHLKQAQHVLGRATKTATP